MIPSQIIKHNTKENNRIPLRNWNSYIKSIYEFPNAMDTIPIVPNFTTTLSTSINKFSFEVFCKMNNRKTNPWYDKECKNARKPIRDDSNESLKLDKINMYKALIKRKKRYYINKRKEQLSQLYKLDHKKFWSQF